MLQVDLTAPVSPKVSARADDLAAITHGLRFGYLDGSTYLTETPKQDLVHLLWRVSATVGYGRSARHVELNGGLHPHVDALQLGIATAYCSCDGHGYGVLCAHIVATWRRAQADHAPRPVVTGSAA